MISRNFYWQLIIRVVLLVLTALAFSFFMLKEQYILAVLSGLLLAWIPIHLVQFLNSTNRKIAFLFQSIKNEDFTLTFSEDVKFKSLREVHQSLNSINKTIQDTQIKNQTQEKYYLEILKHANIGILTINAKGHILFANPTAKKLLNCEVLNHVRQLQKVDEGLYHEFSKIRPFERKLFQLTNERENKQLVIKSNEVVLNEEALILITLQDIDSELDEKETGSWVKLIRVLTHEIMNTITPITSISDSILNYYAGDDVLPIDEKQLKNTIKGLEVIKNQGNDLMSFVQSYRSFLNLPTPDKSIIKADALLEKIMLFMSQEIEIDTTPMQLQITADDLEIFADEKQITQVLINLCKNAIQSLDNDKNGLIQLVYGITERQEKYIMVKDNGPGVSSDLIDQIFVPFFTTKSTGTGIGLSLSKQIMQLHGGTLKVRSVPFQETSFTLVF